MSVPSALPSGTFGKLASPMSAFTSLQEPPHEAPSETSQNKRPATGFKRVFYAANDFIGFKRSYDLPLWIIFGGALFAFSLTRLQLVSSEVAEKTVAPGEWFWYRQNLYYVGLKVHMVGMIPFCLLALFQFVPAIRAKMLLLHRINGYIILLALWIGNAGGLMITRHAFGGTLDFQMAMGFLTLITMVTGGIAYVNIRRLQIDEHRKWMLRTVFYVGTPITSRFIVMSAARILDRIGSVYTTTWRCDELAFTMKDDLRFRVEYSLCGNGTDSTTYVPVPANWEPVERHGSAYRLAFPGALWMAMAIHAVGVEIYLHFTPNEQQRLRQLSYERQVEAGLRRSENDIRLLQQTPTSSAFPASPFRQRVVEGFQSRGAGS